MGQIEDLRLFISIVESNSITKAASELNIAKSAVSRRLALLEERYGTKLIDRGPGNWMLTGTGQELYQRAIQVVGGMDEIEEDFISASADLTGPLSLSVPRDFGISFLNDQLIAFQQHYPDIQLTVDFDDRTIDLARENYDFAIRITPSLTDNIAATRIGTVEHYLVTSSKYINDRPMPQRVDELAEHQLLYFGKARRGIWHFLTSKGKPQAFEFQPFLNSNSGVFLLDATLKGLGIARLPDFIAAKALTKGDLIQVLPEITLPASGIYLVHTETRRLNRRMRLFAEDIKQACTLVAQ